MCLLLLLILCQNIIINPNSVDCILLPTGKTLPTVPDTAKGFVNKLDLLYKTQSATQTNPHPPTLASLTTLLDNSLYTPIPPPNPCHDTLLPLPLQPTYGNLLKLPNSDKTIFNGRVQMYYKGYGSEVKSGRMILEKLEFLQANILDNEARRLKRFVRRTLNRIWTKINKILNKHVTIPPPPYQSFDSHNDVQIESPVIFNLTSPEATISVPRTTLRSIYSFSLPGGKRRLLRSLLKKIQLEEPTYKELVVVWCEGRRKNVEEKRWWRMERMKFTEKEIGEARFGSVQLAEYETLFNSLDVDNSGTLSLSEITSLLTSSPNVSTSSTKTFTKTQIKKIFNVVDTDNDGTISWSEFLQIMSNIKNGKRSSLYTLLKSSLLLTRKSLKSSSPPPLPPPYLKIYHSVPLISLPSTLPSYTLRYKTSDSFRLDIISLLTLTPILLKLTAKKYKLTFVILIAAWLVRSFFRYKNIRRIYTLSQTKFVNDKTYLKDSKECLEYLKGVESEVRGIYGGVVADWLSRGYDLDEGTIERGLEELKAIGAVDVEKKEWEDVEEGIEKAWSSIIKNI
ncbi:hypothetical protein TrST_g4584 [Triparma strigata]|uniref:EF-hand domain-containing protein n=1 Tax=Triparma strigata TaxID=1606541 RepID=A0A9W6ZIT3_9STRA|nr:hypothetical protein TrST_g4584 [Triparma strigata]